MYEVYFKSDISKIEFSYPQLGELLCVKGLLDHPVHQNGGKGLICLNLISTLPVLNTSYFAVSE